MLDQFSRTRIVIGNEGLEKLKEATVAVFGIGGVGGYSVEGLARAGIRKVYISRQWYNFYNKYKQTNNCNYVYNRTRKSRNNEKQNIRY